MNSILFWVFYLMAITCFGQEKIFLNKYNFPIKDTVAYKPHYYQEVFSYLDSTNSKTYNLDHLLLKEEARILGKRNKEIFRTTLDYDSTGNMVARQEWDMVKNSQYSTGFYPDGKLKSRHHYANRELVLEEYYDDMGNPTGKSYEEMPSPMGGIDGWNQYLASNMVYPKQARKKGQVGLVYICFLLDEDGNIQDPEIMNPEQVYPLLAEEALRVIKSYPHRWSPGTNDGIAVPVQMRIPINFQISGF